jgi:hypothetical protein
MALSPAREVVMQTAVTLCVILVHARRGSQQVGIRSKLKPVERAAFWSGYADKK